MAHVRLLRALAGAAALGTIACSDQGGGTAVSPDAAPLSTLPASEQTTRDHSVVRWELIEDGEGRVARGVDSGAQAVVQTRVEADVDGAGTFTFRSLEAAADIVVLDAEGQVQLSSSEPLAAVTQALFADARQPAQFPRAATEAGDAELGTVLQGLAADADIYFDTWEQHYDPSSDCVARTRGMFKGSEGGWVQGTTTVWSPYWFSGCWVNVDITYKTVAGWQIQGPYYERMACGVWDPNCDEMIETTVPTDSVDLQGQTVQTVVVEHTRAR